MRRITTLTFVFEFVNEIFNHNILKVNKNESLLINQRKLSVILRILKNDQK